MSRSWSRSSSFAQPSTIRTRVSLSSALRIFSASASVTALALPRPEDLAGAAARFSQASAAATQCLQKVPSLPTGQSHE